MNTDVMYPLERRADVEELLLLLDEESLLHQSITERSVWRNCDTFLCCCNVVADSTSTLFPCQQEGLLLTS